MSSCPLFLEERIIDLEKLANKKFRTILGIQNSLVILGQRKIYVVQMLPQLRFLCRRLKYFSPYMYIHI